MPKNPSITLPGTVDKIIPSLFPNEAGKVQISVDTPHNLYREVRIENTLTNASGDKVSLKLGSPVEVSITAQAGSTTVQPQLPSSQNALLPPVD
jgi:hypothetical protein